jgi:hypothetical protein
MWADRARHPQAHARNAVFYGWRTSGLSVRISAEVMASSPGHPGCGSTMA